MLAYIEASTGCVYWIQHSLSLTPLFITSFFLFRSVQPMGAPSPLTLPPEQQRKEMGVIDTEVAQEIEGALTPPSADKRLLFGAFFIVIAVNVL